MAVGWRALPGPDDGGGSQSMLDLAPEIRCSLAEAQDSTSGALPA